MESKELLKIRVELLNLRTICVNEQLYEIHAVVRDIEKRFFSGEIEATDENFKKSILNIIVQFQDRSGRIVSFIRDLKLRLLLEL